MMMNMDSSANVGSLGLLGLANIAVADTANRAITKANAERRRKAWRGFIRQPLEVKVQAHRKQGGCVCEGRHPPRGRRYPATPFLVAPWRINPSVARDGFLVSL